MAIDLDAKELNLLKRVLGSYLSELRGEIVSTKHDKQSLHEEEELIKSLLKKIS